MNPRPIWTREQLELDRIKSIELFRKERMEEPLEDYLEFFDEYQGHIEELLETTVDLTQLESTALEVLTDPNLLDAFRYLAAPPISEDDLKVVSEVTSLSRARLSSSPREVQRLIEVVKTVLDRRRFCWVVENREPTEAERGAAVMASAALMAASRVQTNRRSLGKEKQEAEVKRALTELGFSEVPTRTIETTARAPGRGEFCGESILGGRKADIVVHLWDDRLMPIECKVSNSAINSVKRLNNDAAAKAVVWIREFGERQIVPVAVLGGVYWIHNLEAAQNSGLSLFWAHDLSHLTNWIEATRPAP